MKNLFALITLFLGISFSLFSQNDINLNFTSVRGKIVFDTKGTYTSNFTISGLNSDKEVQDFKTAVLANKNVKSLEIFSTSTPAEARKATLTFIDNQEESMSALLKSLPCNNLIIDGKTYNKDQYEQIKVDLAAKKQAAKRENSKDKK
ncbi:MAG: hypothetical protein HY951_03605 [Bacteroidia bacterium]|nr:hypothetical protein [Bacteroidia bacterium]